LPAVETKGIKEDVDVQGLADKVQEALGKELGVTNLAKR
jgi:hypothetical protein